MTDDTILRLLAKIVSDATILAGKHIPDFAFPVNYACIFAQTDDEYAEYCQPIQSLGSVVKQTPTGDLYRIEPLSTVAGNLQLVKIRIPDSSRPEQGDAAFTVQNFDGFKQQYLPMKGFSLIKRPNMEMVELVDPQFSVRAYFSNHPMTEQLGIS